MFEAVKRVENMSFTYLLVNCLADKALLLAAYQAKFEQRLCLCSDNDKISKTTNCLAYLYTLN